MGTRKDLPLSPAETESTRTLLWVTRGAAIVSLLILLLSAGLVGLNEAWGEGAVVWFLLSPLWLTLVVTLVRLRAARLREGARSGVLVGAGGLLLTLVVVAAGWEEWSTIQLAGLSAYGLAQVVLAASGIRLLRALPTPPLPPVLSADPRWARWVKGLALISLAATLGPITVLSVGAAFSEGPFRLLIIFFSAPLWAPYALIWWWLRGRQLKEGLAMAIGLAPLALLVALLIGAVVASSAEVGWVGWFLGAFALIQVGLVAASIGTYYTMPREAGDRGVLRKWVAVGSLGGFIILIVAAIALPGTIRSREAANEASAVGSLRTIVTASVVYNDEYGNGYPPSLAALGPHARGEEASCGAADLVDPKLAAAEKSGYRYEYRAGPATESATAECPAGSKSFVATARPVEYRRSGTRSFFVDESGVIRFTVEDRAATGEDAPLQ